MTPDALDMRMSRRKGPPCWGGNGRSGEVGPRPLSLHTCVLVTPSMMPATKPGTNTSRTATATTAVVQRRTRAAKRCCATAAGSAWCWLLLALLLMLSGSPLPCTCAAAAATSTTYYSGKRGVDDCSGRSLLYPALLQLTSTYIYVCIIHVIPAAYNSKC